MALNKDAGQGRRPLVLDSYARLSQVPDTGEWEKVETQHDDNVRVIERLGSVLGKHLDDGVSAWNKKVRRPGWEELLDRVRAGISDGIVVWHTDRLFRQPRDLEALIDLADKGFRIYSSHGSKDLSNPDDRFILRIEVAHAARSSEDTQRRIKRRLAKLRENGMGYFGPRTFGFPGKDRTWQPPDGNDDLPESERAERPDVPPELVAKERTAIAAAYEAFAAGVTVTEIAREWNSQGLLTATGLQWVASSVRDVLRRARNAGLIEHEGEIVGKSSEEPIVSQEVWERVRAKLAGRRRGRTPSRNYVGTGILRCGACKRKLSSHSYGAKRADGTRAKRYLCVSHRHGCGKVSADMVRVDEEVRKFVIARLSDARYAEAVSAARAHVADRLSQVEAEITECERLQEDLAAKLGHRQMTLKAFEAANAPLAESLNALYAERDELSGGNPEGPTVAQPAEMIAEQWDSADAAAKRALLTRALGDAWLVIDPATQRGQRGWNPDRVRLYRPDDPDSA